MGHQVEAGPQRLRRHLRRPHTRPMTRDQTRSTVHLTDPDLVLGPAGSGGRGGDGGAVWLLAGFSPRAAR